MLERKILNHLVKWKNQNKRMPLIIKGARQVGKTFIVKEFAKNNYENIVEINFIEMPEYKSIFTQNLKPETIYKRMSASIPNINLVPNKTIIFLDEIQECPEARTALKFLSIDGKYDVITTGSLLGINTKQVSSFPVGYVEHLYMYSLDFEEFCWANGVKKDSIEYIKDLFDKKEQVPISIHNNMMNLFRDYICVGGMPKVVDTFVQNHNLADVLRIQRGILEDYKEDIAKYAERTEKVKARACFDSMPKQLSKDYKKFQYTTVAHGGSKRMYGGALNWLYDAGIINFCHNLSIPELPFEGNSKLDEFKVYMHDTGLLMAMLDDGSQADILKDNLGIYKGAIYENVIADIFSKNKKKLYYYCKPNIIEIDFFIREKNSATAVEVKSGNNTKAKSLNNIIKNYSVQKGIKLYNSNLHVVGKVIHIPLYMAMFL